MRQLGLIIAGATLAGLVAAWGCSSSGSSSTASTGATAGTTGGAGGGQGFGGAGANFACSPSASPPSNGMCVVFMPGDAGELDAGLDDKGNASITTCNPLTNAGCTGTDVCGPDGDHAHYVCQTAGSPAGLAVCADCSADSASCGAGGLCIGVDPTGTEFFCARMCCNDSDCGSSGSCNDTALDPPLPSGVGICVPK